MKLRWFNTCDKYGVRDSPSLQYWNEEMKHWECIPYFECKSWEEDEYLEDEYAV